MDRGNIGIFRCGTRVLRVLSGHVTSVWPCTSHCAKPQAVSAITGDSASGSWRPPRWITGFNCCLAGLSEYSTGYFDIFDTRGCVSVYALVLFVILDTQIWLLRQGPDGLSSGSRLVRLKHRYRTLPGGRKSMLIAWLAGLLARWMDNGWKDG